MTIIRVGLAETKNYGQGWDGIFTKGKKAKAAKVAGAGKKKRAKAKKK